LSTSLPATASHAVKVVDNVIQAGFAEIGAKGTAGIGIPEDPARIYRLSPNEHSLKFNSIKFSISKREHSTILAGHGVL
jgi:hypothetical protein